MPRPARSAARFKLGQLKTDDDALIALHKLVYKRPGTSHMRKKNCYEFSGFVFADDVSGPS